MLRSLFKDTEILGARKSQWFLGLLVLFTFGGATIWTVSQKGYAQLQVRDMTQRQNITVRPAMFPFRDGSLFVYARGQSDGDAVLHIYTSKSIRRNRSYLSTYIPESPEVKHLEIPIKAGEVKIEIGGPEEWVNNMEIIYEPKSARKGHLDIFMRCGAGRAQYEE